MTAEPSDPADRLAESLRAIRETFLEDLTVRRTELEAMLGEIRDGAAPAERLPAAARIAHRTAGVSGTLGFPNLGKLAGRVEERLDKALAGPADAGLQDRALEAMAILAAQMARVAAGRSDCESATLRSGE